MSTNRRPRFRVRFSQSQTKGSVRRKCQPTSGGYSDNEPSYEQILWSLDCSSDFHDTLLAPVCFHSYFNPYTWVCKLIGRFERWGWTNSKQSSQDWRSDLNSTFSSPRYCAHSWLQKLILNFVNHNLIKEMQDL